MKKIIFFLMIILVLSITTNINAKTYSFYEAETIDNVYINRYESSTDTLYYQKARFFRDSSTKDFAYCVEPQIKFSEGANYTTSELNLSGAKVKRLKEIAHFGYGYKSHTDKIWYAVTQVMIWQETEGKNHAYFTDTLNGNKITKYDYMIDEINNLITKSHTLPKFDSDIYMLETQELNIKDHNGVLSDYNNSLNLPMTSNSITIKGLKEGTYTINLTRKDNNHNNPALFFVADGSQNLLKTGNLNYLNTSLKVNVVKTKITIKKIDKDTQSDKNTGKATFKDTTFELYNKDTNLKQTLTISDDNTIIIDNPSFGNYVLKEIKAGVGYNLNTNNFEFTIDKDNLINELTIENEVIKKKISIYKTYGTKDNQKKEANIEFNIFDEDNKLIKTIKTNKDGYAEITLPYGKYIIKQLTTTKGYNFIEPIIIEVNDSKDKVFNLKDYKIEVPNTHIDKTNILIYIISILLL